MSCGSSSRAVARKHRPSRVTATPSEVIERNFSNVNGWPRLPTRTCLSTAGPGDVHGISTQRAERIGQNTPAPKSARVTSQRRFPTARYHAFKAPRMAPLPPCSKPRSPRRRRG